MKKSDHRPRCLLRARCERPRRRSHVLGACAVTPYRKAPASLGPGNSWLVFEKELDDALDVSAKAGDEVGARLYENEIRIFGAWRVNLTGFGARLPPVSRNWHCEPPKTAISPSPIRLMSVPLASQRHVQSIKAAGEHTRHKKIVSTSETPSRDGDGACNEVLSVRSQCGQISLSYECRSACRNCPDQVERLRQCSDHE